ncbi:MAG: Gfo/Idh/MocA family protein [Phycisphaeraceae bacterium JB051]
MTNTTSKRIIRWGIIGCGDVCEIKSGPGFYKADNSALTMVMRRNADKAADYAKRHHVPAWSTEADEVINSPEVDIVYIATPVGDHASYALQVADAGKPCYIEKPLTRNHAEAMQIVEAFKSKNLPAFAAFYRRQLPRFVKAKQLIDDGVIGEVTAVNVMYQNPAHQRITADQLPWRVQAEHSGGGLFFDLASHALDVIDYMVGPLVNVTGNARNVTGIYDVEEIVSLRFDLENSIGVGTGCWNFASQCHEDRILIHGSKGKIDMACFAHPRLTLTTKDNEQVMELIDPQHVHQPLIQSIVNELNGQGQCPSTVISAARTAKVMDLATEAYYGNRDGAFWESPESWPGKAH